MEKILTSLQFLAELVPFFFSERMIIQMLCSIFNSFLSNAASTAALTAAMGPFAALSSVLEKDQLEEMIQNAVRKVG